MKVLITGASGSIGGQVLTQCLAHPSISTVVAFVRRDLPQELTRNPKLLSVRIQDFSNWPEDLVNAHADAAAMLWCMGTNTGDRNADLEYPLAFMTNMGRVLETRPSRTRFRYVHLSGKFVRQDQEKKLWLLESARKMKGLLETKALAFAEDHTHVWRTHIVKPGGVVTDRWLAPGAVVGLLGDNWCIRVEELGAFMTYLAIDGGEEGSVTENLRIAQKGRELLAASKCLRNELIDGCI
ncbi:hypothetical protein F5Y15DRAFT_112338 [Xylariaceae sp. FL0016]|nr:hypothetical protein F5Y15DRAFT_112338 [Xylariaceae sp. FL0016]